MRAHAKKKASPAHVTPAPPRPADDADTPTDDAARARSALLAGMAHELRTPLNAIIGFSQMIKMSGEHPLSPEQLIDYAGYIEQSAGGLLDTINILLDAASLDADMVSLSLEAIDPRQVIAASAADFETRAGAKVDIRFTSEPPTIEADRFRLEQMMAAAFACAAGRENGGVGVTVAERAEDGLEICFRGPGAGEIGRGREAPGGQDIFQKKDERPGLRLSIAKRIAELHGGALTLRQSPAPEIVVALPASGRL